MFLQYITCNTGFKWFLKDRSILHISILVVDFNQLTVNQLHLPYDTTDFRFLNTRNVVLLFETYFSRF
ncbi:hypothetical protein NARC_50041 [Candidatus Nitrosocosmicus arcticus]|uniref:Uncharacterized protein n=1 Tax=Candidatus Nitrosocosmicus arcticus TaxID=2035267 RepID=A0A557SW80_9ARCH|nr:hypothetical protein NARC_50041 [Candidatus Nitrosocosmicus arcticus]